MKINNLFIAGIATIGILASCVNDQEVTQNTSGKDLVKVSLQLATGTASTRAVGALPTSTDVTGNDAKESNINRVCVGVFDENGNTVKIYETTSFTTIEGDVTKVGVSFNSTTDAKKVIIAANAPEGSFKNVAKDVDFKAIATDLKNTTSNTTTVNSQLATALPMYSGEEVLTGTSPMTANIKLTRMVARVAITSITNSFDVKGLYNEASFTPQEIFMYNVNTSCKFDGSYTALVNSNSAESTIGTISLTNNTTLSELAYLSTGYQESFSLTVQPAYFYVFPNGSTKPTKLIIKGIWKDKTNATGEVVYYPIIINHAQLGTTFGENQTPDGTTDSQVAANTQYTLTATIQGKGVSSPESDITPAAISLTVAVNDWNTTSQNVTFE